MVVTMALKSWDPFGNPFDPHGPVSSKPLDSAGSCRYSLKIDLFDPSNTDGAIMDVWRVMGLFPQHEFVVGTYSTDRFRAWLERWDDVEWHEMDIVLARGPAAVREAHTAQRALLFAEMLERWGEPPAGAAFPTYDWAEGMRWWSTGVLPNVKVVLL